MWIRNRWISVWWLVSLTAFGGMAYYLIASEIPIVLFFIPVGKITTENQPILFWSVVFAHLAVGALGLVQSVRRARRRTELETDG